DTRSQLGLCHCLLSAGWRPRSSTLVLLCVQCARVSPSRSNTMESRRRSSMVRRSSLVFGLTGFLLLVTAAEAALVDPPRRVRLGTCGGAPCTWCDSGSGDAVCPAAGVEVVQDCEVDVFSSASMCTEQCADSTSGCTSDTTCDLAVAGSVSANF